MATTTHYGTNYSALENPDPASPVAAEKASGAVHCITDRVTIGSTAGDAGSKIILGKLPKGAIPLGGKIKYTGSSTATMKFGHSADDDALGTATAITTTPTQTLFPVANQTALAADYDVEGLTAAAALASGDVFDFIYFYSKA